MLRSGQVTLEGSQGGRGSSAGTKGPAVHMHTAQAPLSPEERVLFPLPQPPAPPELAPYGVTTSFFLGADFHNVCG